MRRYLVVILAVFLLFSVSACGGGGSSAPSSLAGGSNGLASISLTDGPGDFSHVYITLQAVWFHTSSDAGTNTAGWLKFPLSSPVTIDLMHLANGNIEKVWSNLSLPAGHYQQIRFFAVPTEDPIAQSAQALNLKYNNEVIDDANTVYPLRIPAPASGIKLAGTFTITQGGSLDLAVDFDAGHDVVQLGNAFGAREYILKPRLKYFDLGNAGAITGSIANGQVLNSAGHFVIKAEQPSADGTHYSVCRWTTAGKNGNFTLYPLTPGTYDVVIRGLGTETMIVKGVPVTSGSTPASNPTKIGSAITTVTGTDYAIDATVKPTGSWANFFQTPAGGKIPYEIRYRHFDPLDGSMTGLRLSQSPMQVGVYNGGGAVSFAKTDPVEGDGGFQAFADAVMYDRSAPVMVSAADANQTVSFGTLNVTAPAVPHQISGMFSMQKGMMFTSGYVIATKGGIIVNAVSPVPMSGGSTYAVPGLPGGVPDSRYGVEAWGWGNGSFAIGRPRVADLSGGDDTVNIQMMTFTP
ncbi:MAG: DUF4382 domain-containing protein [Nitrospiraceae bacterium]|nr:DUF4382 domain-containing protein [Nitrospiraceae bacterium]